MFIRRNTLANLINRITALEFDNDSHKSRIKGMKAEIALQDRYITSIQEELRYNDSGSRMPVREVVKALVEATGKEAKIREGVPARIVLAAGKAEIEV